MRKQTEVIEAKLEEIIPESDIISGKEIIRDIDEIEPLTKEQRQDIREVFENLEIAHEYLSQSCGVIGALSRSLSSKQLLLLSQYQATGASKQAGRISWGTKSQYNQEQPTRKHTWQGTCYYDSSTISWKHQKWKGEQPNTAVSSHLGL